MKQRISVSAALVTGCILAGPLFAAEPPASIQGRWDLTLAFRGQEKPSWLELKIQDGKLVGRGVGLWGGTHDLKDLAYDNGTVKYTNEFGAWSLTYAPPEMTGELIGIKGDGRLEGTHKITGRRFIARTSIAGRWEFAVIEGAPRKGELELQDARRGDVKGSFRGDGQTTRLENASLMDGLLTFKLADATYTARPHGGVMEGTFKSDKDGKEGKWSAKQQYEWEEPVQIFNGKDMTGWKPLEGENMDNWKVEGGELVCATPGGNIRTIDGFQDFKLHIEFNLPKDGNSGVYLRGRYEVQLLESEGRPPHGGMCAAIYGRVLPSARAEKKAGEWQTYDITLVGQHVTIVFNGKTVADNVEIEGITGGAIDSRESSPGPIYLQGDHSGDIKFRNITVSPLKTEAAPKRKAKAKK